MIAASTGTTLTYQLANLHGDIIATQTHHPDTHTIDTYTETDEYGTPNGTAAQTRFGWLGAYQRSGDAPGGALLMGARAYLPTTGTFLTMDPVQCGGATRYGYPDDPVNAFDLDGKRWDWRKAYRVAKCVGAILWVVGSSLFAVTKIAKIRGAIRSLGGVRETARLIVGATSWSEKMAVLGRAGASAAAYFLGLATIEDNC
jgi:RHS repeat-associated protein